MPGRPEGPLDPAEGPVQALAHALRVLREEAGRPSYRAMAARTAFAASTLSQAAAGERLMTLPVLLAYVRACGGDEREWRRRWQDASREDRERQRPDDGDAVPYRGLGRFEPAHADLFFGRDRLVAHLAAHVRAHRLVALVGASGSGKSSLLRAGLVPLLRTGGDAGAPPRPAAIRILTPGPHPFPGPAAALTPDRGDGDTVVLVDQFEELFTLCGDPGRRSAFLDLLMTAVEPDSRLRVVIAVRADFFGRCAEHPRLAEALRHATLLVGPMEPAELRDVVVRPAATLGLTVERGLTARIVADAADKPGGLPLMSHALLETWRRRKGRTLTLAAYESAGGMQGAIARTAESVYRRLSAEQAATARRVLLRLVTPGQGSADTGRPATREELVIDCRAGERTRCLEVVERLAGARLITLDGGTVTLAHEALLTAWPRLRGWIDAARDRLRLHRRLSADAGTWDELDHDPGALYRGSQLSAARAAFADPDHRDELTRGERSFLDASYESGESDQRHGARTARRIRVLITSMCVLVATALLGGPLLWQDTVISARNSLRYAAVSQALGRAGALRDSDPRQAMRLAVAAYDLAGTSSTWSALAEAATQPQQDDFAVPRDTTAGPPFLVRQGTTVLSAGAQGVRTWDLTGPGGPQPQGDTIGGPSVPSPGLLAVGDNGSELVGQTPGGALQLWRTTSRRRQGKPFGSSTGVPQFDPSGDAVAVMGRGPSGTRAELWSTAGPRLLAATPAASTYDRPVAVSAGAHYIAWCRDDGRPALWNVAGHRAVTLTGDGAGTACPRAVSAADPGPAPAFAPDGRSLALPDGHGALRRWSTDGRALPTMRPSPADPGTGLATTVVYSDDGRFLLTAGAGAATLWRVSDPGRPVRHIELDGSPVRQPVLDTSQHTLRYLTTSADDGTPGQSWHVRTIDLGTAVSTTWDPRGYAAVALSADGARAVLPAGSTTARLTTAPRGGGRPRTRYVPDVVPPKAVGTAQTAASPLVFSADGSRLAYTTSTRATGHGPPDAVAIRNVSDGRLVTTVGLPPGTVSGFALDTSGQRLALLVTNGPRHDVELYDLSARNTPAGKGPWSMPVPSGKQDVVFGSQDNQLIVTGGPPAPGTGAEFTPLNVSFSPDVAGVYADTDSGAVTAFSPDGRFLAVDDASGRLTVYDGEPQVALRRLQRGDSASGADQDRVMAFSAQGRLLAVTDPDGTVSVWDTTDWKLLGSAFPTTGDAIRALAFAPQGDVLYAQGLHTPLQTIDLSPSSMVAQLCARLGGVGLSFSQWQEDITTVPYHRTCGSGY
ncbi:NACHT and WD repeat domain-containing protein [Streptantibioticus silvisoli]|uniref:NACHT and WD repeat domain-containing protein n=1 Tax=Streptantibioticus silvisoli TaxID=2705255 RepID=A0ABT6VY74_9ACTN|nr:NACHT and WD repeat domain-containing protein [Streptantibioticus silvisoli]MDI5963431.1 NACHT and WD repeat domain-containing protein [Streptantibioticus silvisoli]